MGFLVWCSNHRHPTGTKEGCFLPLAFASALARYTPRLAFVSKALVFWGSPLGTPTKPTTFIRTYKPSDRDKSPKQRAHRPWLGLLRTYQSIWLHRFAFPFVPPRNPKTHRCIKCVFHPFRVRSVDVLVLVWFFSPPDFCLGNF